MPLPNRPRDPNQRAKRVVDMATGEVPNDKGQVLAALSEQEQPNQRAKSAKARAASQTAQRRAEVARRAAAVRWRLVPQSLGTTSSGRQLLLLQRT